MEDAADELHMYFRDKLIVEEDLQCWPAITQGNNHFYDPLWYSPNTTLMRNVTSTSSHHFDHFEMKTIREPILALSTWVWW